MELTIAVISAVLAISSTVFSVFTYCKTVSHDRKQATLEAYNRLQTEVFDHINSYPPSEITEICRDTKSAQYKVLSGYLARIEHFCIGINEGIYDKNVFYAMAHGYFDGFILKNRIQPILEVKSNTQQYYSNIYSIIEWMDKKSVKEMRK